MRKPRYAHLLFPLVALIALLGCGLFSAEESDPSESGADLAISQTPTNANFIEFYRNLEDRGRPALVTADSALWAVHMLHDQTLSGFEAFEFVPRLRFLLARLEEEMKAVENIPQKMPKEFEEPARRARMYVQVARALLDPRYKAPDSIKAELARIEKHEGFAFSDVFDQKVDYSQFSPRGHYTRSDELRRYFMASMWLGRVMMRLDEKHPDRAGDPVDHPDLNGGWFVNVHMKEAAGGDEVEIIRIARRFPPQGYTEMRAAAWLAMLMERAELVEHWEAVNDLLKAWMGESEDLGPDDLIESFHHFLGDKYKYHQCLTWLADKNAFLHWVAYLAQQTDPQIDATGMGRRGFLLLGQRSIVDARIFQKLVSTEEWKAQYLGEQRPFTLVRDQERGLVRGFPRGWDLQASMGNQLALNLIEEAGDANYNGYHDQLDKTRKMWDKYVKKEPETVYKLMIESAQEAGKETPPENAPAYVADPQHMRIRLNAALGFWSTLRRDTILYSKQSATGTVTSIAPSKGEPPRGYVDPFPQLYRDLGQVSRKIGKLIEKSNELPPAYTRNCEAVDALMDALRTIANKELNRPRRVNEKEYELIRKWGGHLEQALQLPSDAVKRTGFSVDEPAPMIADVHTHAPEVLEVAVGRLWNLDAQAPVGGRDLTTVRGALFSYYEFRHPMEDRLTDEKWRDMLDADEAGKPLMFRP